MAASSDAVDGTKISGATSLNSGTEGQNGAFLASADDVTSINAARANMQPVDRGTRSGKTGKMYGAGANPAHTALPSTAKDGGY